MMQGIEQMVLSILKQHAADPSANNSTTYQTYCLLSDDTKWGGTGGWTLATHIPFRLCLAFKW